MLQNSMTIKQFIKKAIQGKYHIHGTPFESENHKIFSIESDTKENTIFINYEWNNEGKISYPQATILIDQKLIHEMVLDPKAWEAVVKVEGWGNIKSRLCLCGMCKSPKKYPDRIIWEEKVAQWRMHELVNALCAGKTIEEYLETL